MRLAILAGTATVVLFTTVSHGAETTRFEGRYEYRTDAESLEMLGEQVCFFPSAPSSANVPRPPGDARLPWFCFTNSNEAARLLGFDINHRSEQCGFQGTASIIVSHYQRYAGEGDANDLATLDKVLNNAGPNQLPCSR